MSLRNVIHIIFSVILLTVLPYGEVLSADFDPNEWFDECPDDLCGAPPAGGAGGGGGGGGPIIVNYDLGPLFSLDEDIDADGVSNSMDNCPEKPNGPELGICTTGTIVNNPCRTSDDCGAGGFCSMNQEDTDGDGLGDACDEALHHYYPSMQEALDAMESNSMVTVRTVEVEAWEEDSNHYYAFEPNNVDPKVGFIIYPGAWLDPRAYAPPAHAIAAQGFLAVIVKMPDDVAALGHRRANEIMSAYPGIERWSIGGHSIGGSFSCAYAKEFTDKVDGVILWASWPSENFRLDDTDLKAISIYGTNDGHPETIEAGAEHLPADAEFVKIEGGNHTQFGWYDTSPNPTQEGDNPADITREEQQAQIIEATIGFLELF